MREELKSADQILAFASKKGFELSQQESAIVCGYLLALSDSLFELDEKGDLYFIDNYGYFDTELFDIPDVMEIVTKTNADFLADALDDCVERPSECGFKILTQLIAEQDTISNLWKRLYNNLVCA